MTFGTYAALQAEVNDWLHRSDLAAKVPGFITLAEAAINRKLNIAPREIDAPLTMTPGSRYVTKPTDMSEPIALWCEQDQPRERLIATSPEAMTVSSDESGKPLYWAIDGANIAFDKAADAAYPLTFRYAQDTALSDANPTNEILSRAPDLYLYGALAHAAPYLRDDSRVAVWENKFITLLRAVHAEYSRAKSVAPLMTEVPSSTLNTTRRSYN